MKGIKYKSQLNMAVPPTMDSHVVRLMDLKAILKYIVDTHVSDLATAEELYELKLYLLLQMKNLQEQFDKSDTSDLSGELNDIRFVLDTKIADVTDKINNAKLFDGIPKITQVRIPASQFRDEYINSGVSILLDRPAPANCFIQFHRYAGRTGHRTSNKTGIRGRRIRKAFRPIDINSARIHGQNYWVLHVPQGARVVHTAPIRQLYRPPRTRGPDTNFHQNRMPTNLYQGLGFKHALSNTATIIVNRQHANKCIYKFSVGVFGTSGNFESGELSSESLLIMNWILAPWAITLRNNNLNIASGGMKLIAKLY